MPADKVKVTLSSKVLLAFFLSFVAILLVSFQVQLTLIFIGVLLGILGIALEIIARRVQKKESKKSKTIATSKKRNYFVFGLAISVLLAGIISFAVMNKQTPKDGTYEYDINGDGTADDWQTYKNGSIVKTATDRNSDGKADVWWEYKNGLVALEKADNDFNGTPDVTYYFEDGVVSIAEFRPNEATEITKKQIFQYGVLREEWIDKDLDGKFDERIIFDFLENPVKKIPFPAIKLPVTPHQFPSKP